MLGDEDAYRRAIRASADEAVAEFIASLDQDQGRPPPPPKIEISEVEGKPVEFDFMPFGTQGAETLPHGQGGGLPPAPPPSCNATAPVSANLVDFDHIDLSLRVYGHVETTCNMGGSAPWIWVFDETFTRNLLRENRSLTSPAKPTGTHFQIWLDTSGFEHIELPLAMDGDCFNCFGGWTSCTTALQVGGFMGQRVNLCPSGYSPEDSGDTWYVAAQFTWFNAPFSGWSTSGNELQFYYYDTQFYECNTGSPSFLTCHGIGMNPGSTPFDSLTSKNIANLPGTYTYDKVLLSGTVGSPPVPVYLHYVFTVHIY